MKIPKITKEQKEAQKEAKKIIKQDKNLKPEMPTREKNILEWTTNELKTYILTQTYGFSPAKKIKFVNDLLKEIKEEKKKKGLD